MLDKFYVPVSAVTAKSAADFFLKQVQEGTVQVGVDGGTLNQLMTFCTEISMLASHRNTDFHMTNTQAVWVYTWHDRYKEECEKKYEVKSYEDE